MEGVKVTQTGRFQKSVYASIIDTFPGGVTINPTGLSAKYPDGYIPAGTLVSVPNATTNLSEIVNITAATPDTYNAAPLGFTVADVKIDGNTFVGVVIAGTVKVKALPNPPAGADVKTAGVADDLAKVLTRITFDAR